MTRGRMSPAIILALIAVLGFCLVAVANEKPVVITKSLSPNATAQTPDPNWELKQQMGVVENPGSAVPDFDPLGKVGPKKGPAPIRDMKSTLLGEDFEVSVPPAGWGEVSTHTDTMTWYQDDYNPYSGLYLADCKYDEALVPQDEWLTTPVMDFEGATSDLKLTFHFLMSYYWGIDPYDNYNLEVWISTDAGANFTTKLWDEGMYGLFDNWVWYEVNLSLASYVGEKDVVLGFRYVGVDGAQGSFDLISVNDDPPPPGRCCYGDPLAPSCTENTQFECEALGDFMSWEEGLTCADACPVAGPGDNCNNPLTMTFPADLPYTNNNYTCGRGNDYSEVDMCYTYGYGSGEDIVYEITVTSDVQVTFTMDPKGTTWTYCEIRTSCVPPSGECVTYFRSTAGDPYSSSLISLAAGTYYMIIDTWATPDCIPDFDISVEEFTGSAEGDECGNPIMLKLPDDMPYLNTNATCGRMDYYNTTCLGSYDGGEDIIYQVDVDATVTVDIILDPKGTTYTGIAIDANCPLDASSCIATSTNSGSGVHGLYGVTLDPGTYYIMIDTYPSPNCIPDFDLSITTAAGGPENDDCANAIKIGDVVDLAFTTVGASFDGGGTCLTSPNVWYCYTASCDGNATFSLCGSGYDTKMAVYDGCFCDPLGTQLGCNDDACGLQSQLILPVVAGQEYMIEVGGYGSNFGTGVLNVSCAVVGPPPANDNCADVTPTTLTAGVTTTFTGNNVNATNDCSALAPATEAWEAFTIDEAMDITITYCGTNPSFDLVYIILADACPCGELTYATTTDWDACGDGNITMYFPGLPAGTYYIPVLAFHPDYTTGYYYAGDYTINVTGTSWEPAYCDASGGCDEYISNVTVAEINNTSACSGYADYTDQIANMQFGAGYPITITNGNPYSTDYAAVWVDWNQDMIFDAAEKIVLDVNYGYGPYSGTITPPGDALAGFTRMRVRISYSTEPAACGATSYGEAEDYTINVGGEQSILTIDPDRIDFGTVPPGATGNSTLTLGADGTAPISYSIAIEYGAKNAVGGGQSEPALRTNPFRGTGHTPAADKNPNQLLFEGFEGGTVPPPDWTAVVNNAYTWEIDSYDPYEGSYNASCFYDEAYTGTQDEWLISPVIDFGGGKYVLDFWWLGSYYWSVDPYDNCDFEVWISLDGGTSWTMMLWSENDAGIFDNWTWYNAVVDLSFFKDESNVKLGFHYYGYDGAQFSLDAIGLNPAPLSWVSVAPTSGSIEGGGTAPITVSYDASDLELGLYGANLVITHTGAANKTVDMVPVSMTVGEESQVEIDPWPVFALARFAMEPITGHIYIRDDDLGDYPGYAVGNIDETSFQINGGSVPTTGIDFPAESFFDVSFSLNDFIDYYPLMWDVVELPYTVSGLFTDATPFTISRTVDGIGHVSGDANLDGQANVGDAVFLISYVFKEGTAPRLDATADANCDGNVNVADAVRLVNYIFRSGTVPCHP